MSPQLFHWFVLAGGLSPYTLGLWEKVAARPNHAVTLAYVPRVRQSAFAHEEESIRSQKVELVQVRSLKAVVDLGLRCAREPHAAIVCLGYSPIYNLFISSLVRTTRRHKHKIFYMSDTNGIALANRVANSWSQAVALLAKRTALSYAFGSSFDLGFSNALAHSLLGMSKRIDIPLLTVEFPSSMETELPDPLASSIGALPRPRLLTVARLIECKNLVGLVRAFAQAAREGMPGSLTIVGEGPERARIAPLLEQISGRVILAGSVPFAAARRIFGAYDGVVMASTTEAWGISIIEGLGWGLPVLSSRQCGAGLTLALEMGDAVKLCGTSAEEIASSLQEFVVDLARHSHAAKAVAPRIRRKYGMAEVADALAELASGIRG